VISDSARSPAAGGSGTSEGRSADSSILDDYLAHRLTLCQTIDKVSLPRRLGLD
jgi:hypothetical protein